MSYEVPLIFLSTNYIILKIFKSRKSRKERQVLIDIASILYNIYVDRYIISVIFMIQYSCHHYFNTAQHSMEVLFFFIYKTAVDVATTVAAVAVAVVAETAADRIEVPVYNQQATVLWRSPSTTHTVAAAAVAVVAHKTPESDAAAADSTVASSATPAVAHCNHNSLAAVVAAAAAVDNNDDSVVREDHAWLRMPCPESAR